MRCPKCHNKGFMPSRDVKKPIKNLGDKQYYETFITRRYICLQCGFSFITKEEYYRDVQVQKQTLDLLEKHAH